MFPAAPALMRRGLRQSANESLCITNERNLGREGAGKRCGLVLVRNYVRFIHELRANYTRIFPQ